MPDWGDRVVKRTLDWLVERGMPDPQYSVSNTVAVVCTRKEPGEIVEQLDRDWPHAKWRWEETKSCALPRRYEHIFWAKLATDAAALFIPELPPDPLGDELMRSFMETAHPGFALPTGN